VTKKMSWFDWFVTGSFWLMGLAMAIGIIVVVLQEIREPAAQKKVAPVVVYGSLY
jgi:hypothetical protein